MDRAAAALARREAVRAPADRPSQRRSAASMDASEARAGCTPALMRTKSDDGATHIVGVASVTERAYEMYDMYGPYMEVVALDAFDVTLAADPKVLLAPNHSRGGGLAMANTRNGTLTLTVVKDGEAPGLHFDGVVDTTRTDVADAVKALERRDAEDASFKFRIARGQWSPDYTEYRILEVDMHGGDVSPVDVGASPHAFSGVRSAATEAAPRSGRDAVPESALLAASLVV